MRCNMIEVNEMERTKRIDVNIVWCIRDMMSNVRTVCMLYIVYAITGRGKQSADTTTVRPICFNCGKDGHYKSVCRSTAVSEEEQQIAKTVPA